MATPNRSDTTRSPTSGTNDAIPPRRTRQRHVLPLWLVLASLFIGLLATAASVVVASYLLERQTAHSIRHELVAWEAEMDYRTHVVRVWCVARPGAEHWRTDVTPAAPGASRPRAIFARIDPADDRRPAMARVRYRGVDSGVYYSRAGWPLLAAEGVEAHHLDMVVTGGVVYEVAWLTTARFGGESFDIPLRPIPLGVLANTLFYAAPVLALLATTRLGLLTLRGRRRARRGRCTACGYELGEGISVCPECGRAMAKHAAMPPHQSTHKPIDQPPPHYLHLAPGVAPPELDRTTPSRAVVVVEADVEMPWRLLVCDWLVRSGCLYVMAWGRECGLWHDCVDECHLAEFGFGDIPDERHVMTTWHEDEPLGDVFRFCQNCASHPHVDLTRTIIMHIAAAPREAELLAAYRAAADD